MSFTALDENPVDKKTSDDSNIKHARCCKAALPKGLCGQGPHPDAPPPLPRLMKGTAEDCVVCLHLWRSGHHSTCPRDSGRW